MRKVLAIVLIAGVVTGLGVLMLRGGRPAQPDAAVTPSARVTAVTTATASSSPSVSTSDVVDETATSQDPSATDGSEPVGRVVTPGEVATASTAAQAARWAAATEAAAGFMRAFARPAAGVSPGAWWARAAAYLSPSAAEDYAGTDPANVPFTTVTGTPAVMPMDAPDELVIAVRVLTDAGAYMVEVTTTPSGVQVTRATPSSK